MPEIQQSYEDWLICDNCGELQTFMPLHQDVKRSDYDGGDLNCSNCGADIYQHSKRWLEVSGALAITSLILFILAVLCPIFTLELGPIEQSVTILEGFVALFQRDNWLLAGLVLSTLVIIPFFEIFALMYLLAPYSFKKRLPAQPHILRWLTLAQSWSMLEVFLVSMVIGAVKMADMAKLNFELGSYVLFVLVGVLSLAFSKLDRQKLWSAINPNNYFITRIDEEVYDCRMCGAMVGKSIAEHSKKCPRCYSKISKRIPQSLEKTTALVLAAVILYIPANILPIMKYTSLGVVKSDTIFSGVVSLLSSGLYWIAAVVFIASIAVPILKMIILFFLIWSVRAKYRLGVKQRMKLYHFTEFIGRWSMIDVFVVTIFVGLIQFGFFSAIEPEPAIIAFAGVVILTMLAAESFDSRLLWDVLDEEEEKHQPKLNNKKLSGLSFDSEEFENLEADGANVDGAEIAINKNDSN